MYTLPITGVNGFGCDAMRSIILASGVMRRRVGTFTVGHL